MLNISMIVIAVKTQRYCTGVASELQHFINRFIIVSLSALTYYRHITVTVVSISAPFSVQSLFYNIKVDNYDYYESRVYFGSTSELPF